MKPCPATTCVETIRPDLFACRRHWRQLPGYLRRHIRTTDNADDNADLIVEAREHWEDSDD